MRFAIDTKATEFEQDETLQAISGGDFSGRNLSHVFLPGAGHARGRSGTGSGKNLGGRPLGGDHRWKEPSVEAPDIILDGDEPISALNGRGDRDGLSADFDND